jgi:hypothetical protein
MKEKPEILMYKALLSACVNGYMKRIRYNNVEVFYFIE